MHPYYHHHLPLVTLCGKSIKQSHCQWAAERFKSSFLTLQDKPNTHAWGTKSPTQHFPSLPRPSIRVTHLDYRVRLLCTRMLAAWERCAMFKEGKSKVHSQVQSGTLLTDYHISWHVASTLKRLTTCTTHCGLRIFSLNWWGLNHKYHPMTPPINLMIAICDKPVRTYNLASSRKLLVFYRS